MTARGRMSAREKCLRGVECLWVIRRIWLIYGMANAARDRLNYTETDSECRAWLVRLPATIPQYTATAQVILWRIFCVFFPRLGASQSRRERASECRWMPLRRFHSGVILRV